MATSALLVQIPAQIQAQTAAYGEMPGIPTCSRAEPCRSRHGFDAGIGLGSAVAVVCSWQRNRSILWARTVKVTR